MKANLKYGVLILSVALLLLGSISGYSVNRFPKPEFENGHVQPPTLQPEPRAEYLFWVDIAVLVAALSLITWLILKKRSRTGVLWVSIFSLLYFGFLKEGCICSIGSIQNITLALFKTDYAVPVTAVLFFVIPLLYTLFFGRTFCAGVCPFGALQDLVSFRPVSLSAWLEKTLGVIPFIYLALAILYSATGTDFIICRYDPFVGFFRLDGSFMMLAIGGVLLLIGVFISRPYCRFLCPYGALLNIVSRFSWKHMTITPSACIQCKLCENSCPVGAINKPTSLREQETPATRRNRFILLFVMVPVLVVSGGLIGNAFHQNVALVNPKVKLAKELINDSNFGVQNEEAIEITAFKTAGKSREALFSEAAGIIDEFKTGTTLAGGFIGLVFGLTLMSLSVFRYRKDYTPNKATCINCARCMDYCPVEADKNLNVAVK